tara:strand:- start:734 stop:853 length:120 start_codon:yes stop_codon:yes gene_type:complete
MEKYDNDQDAVDDQLKDIVPEPWVDAQGDVDDDPIDLEK